MNEHEVVSQLWEIVQAVATEYMTYASECTGDVTCLFCYSDEDYSAWDHIKHDADCLVVKARALVWQRGQGII